MATRNPFGQLRVERDEDEEVAQTVTKTTTTPLFQNLQVTEQKKKKKVRPDEKKKSEETVEESTEGFEVVGGKPKVQRHYRANNSTEEGETGDESRVKKDKHASKVGQGNGMRPVRPGKRQFERHSGTGRGKEVAKNGAGGKTVWGDNSEYMAKQALKEDRYTDDKCKNNFQFNIYRKFP